MAATINSKNITFSGDVTSSSSTYSSGNVMYSSDGTYSYSSTISDTSLPDNSTTTSTTLNGSSLNINSGNGIIGIGTSTTPGWYVNHSGGYYGNGTYVNATVNITPYIAFYVDGKMIETSGACTHLPRVGDEIELKDTDGFVKDYLITKVKHTPSSEDQTIKIELLSL